jgi:2-polyprenyl-3-methyl-5-hydroxy-6-metoxy-1,4-benzoquinol methylase
MDQQPAPRWWETLYDEQFVDLLMDRGSQESESTAADLICFLHLQPGQRVFDQCCGFGRLSLPLAQRGMQVIGVDQAQSYIARAREDASRAGVSIDYEVADALEFVPPEPCDVAFNWWTSFGYYPDDFRNRLMIRRAHGALKPGGLFALDTMNPPGVLRHFQPTLVNRHDSADGQTVLLRESQVDLHAGTLNKRWTYFLAKGERVVHDTVVRLYMPHQLVEMFQAAGFTEVELFADCQGKALTIDDLRCIVRARKR